MFYRCLLCPIGGKTQTWSYADNFPSKHRRTKRHKHYLDIKYSANLQPIPQPAFLSHSNNVNTTEQSPSLVSLTSLSSNIGIATTTNDCNINIDSAQSDGDNTALDVMNIECESQ